MLEIRTTLEMATEVVAESDQKRISGGRVRSWQSLEDFKCVGTELPLC